MNIILDMDETLIGAQFAVHSENLPFFDNAKPYIITTCQIHERPFLDVFFEYVFNKFERVSIWTHGTTEWYNTCYEYVLKKYIPKGKHFYKVITRDNNILPFENDLSKPLHKFYMLCPYHNENNTFILDDYKEVKKTQPKNCISIHPFFFTKKNSQNDKVLLNLIPYLSEINKDGRNKIGKEDL